MKKKIQTNYELQTKYILLSRLLPEDIAQLIINYIITYIYIPKFQINEICNLDNSGIIEKVKIKHIFYVDIENIIVFRYEFFYLNENNEIIDNVDGSAYELLLFKII